MMSNLKERFERSCRLCAKEQDVTLLIFSSEAEAMLLRNKLNKYLLIEVDEDDKLPKNICIQCCTKLQTLCDFIDTARKSQEILLSLSIELDQFQIPSVSYEDCDIIKATDKSEKESVPEDSKIRPTEISVNSTMILQNSEAMLSPNVDISSEFSTEDVSHLHGLDGENVTIKLIKKTNIEKTEMVCKEVRSNKGSHIFMCQICKKTFDKVGQLQNHYWTHSADEIKKQDYTCSICDEEFVYKYKLIQHLRIHKMNGRCKICGRFFRTAEKLNGHMSVHSRNKSYTCKICERSYDCLSNLRTHSVTHSNDRPYECTVCPKKFKRTQDLKFHMNQHTGHKPYKCPFCDKCFASSGNCYSHRSRIHPGRVFIKNKILGGVGIESRSPKPMPNTKPASAKVSPTKPPRYSCDICAHTFMKKDNYTYHMYQHTGEKPFNCLFCSERFVTRRGLSIHHDIKHPTKNRPLALVSRNLLLN